MVIVLAAGFLFGLWELYRLRFEAGDIYPQYSSLRADPLGAKALYDSLSQVPGISTARNYRALPQLQKGKATIFFLGEDPFEFAGSSDDQLQDYEALARAGARVVIAMRPVRRLLEETKRAPTKQNEAKPFQPPMEKRWGIRFEYITRSMRQADEDDNTEPKLTALYFRSEGKVLYRIERQFGSGAVVLLANGYPFSNEALAGERETKLLSWAVGGSRRITFDEHHLGLTESGGVVTLARKYNLEGLAAALLVLVTLFIWKNSTSLLPARPEQAASDDSVETKDAGSGLANLLRRNIPAKELAATCLKEWEASQHGGKFYSEAKIERVRRVLEGDGRAIETYRKVSRILSDRSDG